MNQNKKITSPSVIAFMFDEHFLLVNSVAQTISFNFFFLFLSKIIQKLEVPSRHNEIIILNNNNNK